MAVSLWAISGVRGPPVALGARACSVALWIHRVPSGREPGEGGVEECASEPVGEWGVALEEAVVERAVEHVEGELGVGGFWQFAALDCSLQDLSDVVAAGLEKALAVLLGECGVGLRFGDERGDDASVGS